MTCENCDIEHAHPGKRIRVTEDGTCPECGNIVSYRQRVSNSAARWDRYFLDICITIASNSRCLSRRIGAILVRDKSIVSTGYNGPPRGVPHCGHERFRNDKFLAEAMQERIDWNRTPRAILDRRCPRQLMGFASGEGLQYCIAQHAEENCISNAARLGVSTLNTTLYMNSVVPCKNCLGTLINAGISEIVVETLIGYDKEADFLLSNSPIQIRTFHV